MSPNHVSCTTRGGRMEFLVRSLELSLFILQWIKVHIRGKNKGKNSSVAKRYHCKIIKSQHILLWNIIILYLQKHGVYKYVAMKIVFLLFIFINVKSFNLKFGQTGNGKCRKQWEKHGYTFQAIYVKCKTILQMSPSESKGCKFYQYLVCPEINNSVFCDIFSL